MDEQKKQKTKKILNIVLDVVVGVILVFALLLTIGNVSSKKKGYTSIFGSAFLVVQTESMNAPMPEEFVGTGKPEGFAPGDMLRIKILKDEAKSKLELGDIMSFRMEAMNENGDRIEIINSHRIVEIGDDNGKVMYKTKGDNNELRDSYWIYADETTNGLYCVIGVVKSNMGGIGKVFNFFNSSTGFLVCIVIPSFLVVFYFAFILIREVLVLKKAGAAEDKAKYEEELLAKLRAQGVQIPADMENNSAETTAENGETSEGENK